MTAIGFIGLGKMGGGMVRRLAVEGVEPIVFDRDPAAARRLDDGSIRIAGTCGQVFGMARTVIVCLPSVEASLAVARELAAAGPDCPVRCYVETSTIGPSALGAVSAILAPTGIDLVDAPVSGGPKGAQAGTLVSMVAASASAWDLCRPAVETYSNKVFLVGDRPGLAQACKLVNNVISIATLALASEAMAYGVRQGLDLATLVEVVNAGSGRSAVTTDKFPKAIVPRTFDYGASMETGCKDIALFVEEASRTGCRLGCAPAIADVWSAATQDGDPGRDFTEIFRFFEDGEQGHSHTIGAAGGPRNPPQTEGGAVPNTNRQ